MCHLLHAYKNTCCDSEAGHFPKKEYEIGQESHLENWTHRAHPKEKKKHIKQTTEFFSSRKLPRHDMNTLLELEAINPIIPGMGLICTPRSLSIT